MSFFWVEFDSLVINGEMFNPPVRWTNLTCWQRHINISWLIPWIWRQRRPTISSEWGRRKVGFWISSRNRNRDSWCDNSWNGVGFLFLWFLLVLVPRQKTSDYNLLNCREKQRKKMSEFMCPCTQEKMSWMECRKNF